MILSLCGGIAAQERDEPIRVDSTLVILNATVTDKGGRPLSGIKKGQVSVKEDGVAQAVEIFEAESTPFAAVILIDTSGSMEERLNLARSAAITFLDGLRPDDVASIYNFDSAVTLVQDFSNSTDIADRIFDLRSEGMTVLNDAIVKASGELGKRKEKRRAIVVLSDGADTKSAASGDRALMAALSANATIYTVDMSDPGSAGWRERVQSQLALKEFAEKSGGLFVTSPGGTALRDAFKNIVSELRIQYTIGYQPINQSRDGKWRKIEVRVQYPESRVRTRKGYNASKQN